MEPVEYLVFKLKAPIIVDKRWCEIPQQMKDRVRLERLAKIVDDEMSTDYEAMVFLHTASLAQPFNQTWFNIYTYLFNQFHGDIVPKPNIGATELNEMEKAELVNLKSWIYKQQLKEWKRKRR